MDPLSREHNDEEGSVLLAVVGIMLVLTILVIGAFAMADNSLYQSKRNRASAQALSVAESGLDQALWMIKTGNPPTTGLSLTLPTGIGSVTATKTTNYTWTVTATGSSNTTPSVSRTITCSVFSMSIWDMFYADGPVKPGGNGHINGNGEFHGSWYMRGDWPASNGNATFDGGPYFVKDGNVNLGGSAQLGYPKGVGETKFAVDLYCNGTVSPSGVYANIYTDVPDLPLPKQGDRELSDARNTAMAESRDDRQGAYSPTAAPNNETRESGFSTGAPSPRSGNYKIVDNDGNLDGSVASFALGAGQPSFGEPYDPAIGRSRDDFAWDAAAGVLTVQGTVFIDARELTISNVKWAGKGTIVCWGNVLVTGTWEPKTLADYPDVHCVGISASGHVDMYSPNGYGPFYAATYWSMDPGGNGHSFHGEIVAPDITLGKHSKVWCTPNMSSNMPPSMPAGTGVIVVPSGWHEGRR